LHLHGAILGEETADDLREILHVWPKIIALPRAAGSMGFWPPLGGEALTHESHRGVLVKALEFAGRVHEQTLDFSRQK